METQICVICSKEKELIKFGDSWEGGKKKRTCKSCYGERERVRFRLDFLEAFNFECQCCGESDIRFLTLDHVNSDGNEHREIYKDHQIYRLARREGYPRDKYTCLCFNCNSGRSCNKGVCPHKDIILKQEYLENLKAKLITPGFKHVQHNTSNLPQAREKLVEQRTEVTLSNLLKKYDAKTLLSMLQSK